MNNKTMEGMPEAEAYNFISLAGNHAVKGMVIDAFTPGCDATLSTIQRHIIDLQGPDPVWVFKKGNALNFCTTLEKANIVSQDAETAHKLRTYRVTDNGTRLAKPLVGHLFDLALQSELPLIAFYGPTQSTVASGVRPSGRRLQLMQLLIRNSGAPTALAAAAQAQDLPIHKMQSVAEDLASYGILNVESSGRGNPTVTFQATSLLWNLPVRQQGSGDVLTDTLAVLQDHFREHPNTSISNADIVDRLLSTGHYQLEPRALLQQVSRKTHHFAYNRHALLPSRQIGGGNVRGAISATPSQLTVMTSAIAAVNGLCKPTARYVDNGRDKLAVIVSDPELVKQLVAKAQIHSTGRKSANEAVEHTRSLIEAALATSPDHLTVREIQRQLTKRSLCVDQSTVTAHLRRLQRVGKVVAEVTKHGAAFRASQD